VEHDSRNYPLVRGKTLRTIGILLELGRDSKQPVLDTSQEFNSELEKGDRGNIAKTNKLHKLSCKERNYNPY
jgi:hypothetical protein